MGFFGSLGQMCSSMFDVCEYTEKDVLSALSGVDICNLKDSVDYDAHDMGFFDTVSMMNDPIVTKINIDAKRLFQSKKSDYCPGRDYVSPHIQVNCRALFCEDVRRDRFAMMNECDIAVIFINTAGTTETCGLKRIAHLEPLRDPAAPNGISKIFYRSVSRELERIAEIESRRLRFQRFVEFIRAFAKDLSNGLEMLGYRKMP